MIEQNTYQIYFDRLMDILMEISNNKYLIESEKIEMIRALAEQCNQVVYLRKKFFEYFNG